MTVPIRDQLLSAVDGRRGIDAADRLCELLAFVLPKLGRFALRAALFRDDCHFVEPGAAFAASAICAARPCIAHPLSASCRVIHAV